MKNHERLAAVGLALAMMAGPRAPLASAEEEVEDDVADLDEDDLGGVDPGLLYSNTCDPDKNVEIANGDEKRRALLIRYQVAVSIANALHNLKVICPQRFPETSELLLSDGPHRWLKVVMRTLWAEQLTAEGVIAENLRVMTRIEDIAGKAEWSCRALEQNEEGVRNCQRDLIKDMAKN